MADDKVKGVGNTLADNKVIYEVRADNSKLDGDLKQANSKTSGAAGKLSGIAKTAGLAIGGAVFEAGAAVVKFGSEFETSMAMASTLFGETTVDSDALNKKMLDLSSSTGVAANEMGGALYQALSAGVPVTEDMGSALEFLDKSNNLAKGSGTDFTTVIDTETSVLNAYKMGVGELDNVQKVLLQTQNNGKTTVAELGASLAQVTPTAAAMGVGFDQVGAALATMTTQSTPTAQATTQLNSLFEELGESGTNAANNLDEATKGTQYAGMSFTDMMDAGVPLNEVLNLIGDHADASGLSMHDMFSSVDAGNAALANSGENAETFADNLSAMSTETDVVGESFDKMSGTSADKFDKILNELKNTAITLFLEMAPFIEELLPNVSEIMDRLIPPIMDLAIQLMPLILDFIDAILPSLSDLITDLIPAIVEILTTLMPVLTEIVSMLLPPLVSIIAALLPVLEPILNLMMPLLDIFMWILDPIVALIDKAIVPLIDFLVQLINAGLIPVQNAMQTMFLVVSEVFEGITSYVTEQAGRWIDIFKNIIDFIKNVFTGNWRGAWENVKNIFKTIAEGISAAFKLPINLIIDGINGFIRGLNQIEIPDWVPLVGGKSFKLPTIPRLKVGMDYVPRDNFLALLHQGETVLTAPEASAYQSVGGLEGIERMLSTVGNSDNSFTVNMYGDWNVREEADIDKVSQAIYARVQSEKRGRGIS